MRIVILGAGQVGASLAQALCHEGHDITVIDRNKPLLQKLQSRLDLRTVAGFASHPNVLEKAGASDAEMLIAVTHSDETNIIACRVAHALFHTPIKIARVRSGQYHRYPELFQQKAFPVDLCISPETLITQEVAQLIEHPGANQVVEFMEGKIRLVAVTAHRQGQFTGLTLEEIAEEQSDQPLSIAAVFRRGKAVPLSKKTCIEVHDEVYLITTQQQVKLAIAKFRRLENPYQRIIIAGGGNLGLRLAQYLEPLFQVKILEKSPERCEHLAEELNSALVLNGSACDLDLLQEENVETCDVFCSLTNDDEDNILSALQAKRLGARTSIALIAHPAYVDLITGSAIDIAISPQQITASYILTHIRSGNIVSLHTLKQGLAEVVNIMLRGDAESSKVVGQSIEKLILPTGVRLVALIREDTLIPLSPETTLMTDDHVILFVTDRGRMREVERLFQVDFSFV